MTCVYSKPKMQVFLSQVTTLLFNKSAACVGFPTIKTEGNNAAILLVGDLGPYRCVVYSR
jgi:hypothetical protein